MTRTKGHDTNTTSSEADTSSSIATTSDEVNEPTQTKESSPSSPPPAKPTKGSENHPKGIDLNFELADLTEEEKEKYERLSNAYGLDVSILQHICHHSIASGFAI